MKINKFKVINQIMKLLHIYLPKDVSNIILDYLYKPDIRKLNKEYHNTYKITTNDKIKNICGFNFNFRTTNPYYITNIREVQYTEYRTCTFLPKKYWYSSGCNNLNRYREK